MDPVEAETWPRRLAAALLDLLYPPRCVSCGGDAGWLCPACVDSVTTIEPPYCPTCGIPGDGGRCGGCAARPLRLERIRAAGVFDGALEQAVIGLKYHNLTAVGPALGALMADTWRRQGDDIDLIVPVPLHPKRWRTRGYNQSLVLARVVGRRLGVPVMPHALRRIRATRDQIGLTRQERERNVEEAFALGTDVARRRLRGRRLLLVDDVCTTGFTLDACAAALQQADVHSVSALVAARRPWSPEPVRREEAAAIEPL